MSRASAWSTQGTAPSCAPCRHSDLVVAPEVGRVFALGHDRVTLLDARTGALVRTLTLGPDPADLATAVAVDARSGHAFVTTLSGVTMLDARRGTILRRIPVGGRGPADIAVDERRGRAFLAVERGGWPRTIPGAVRILDTRTGATLRAIPVPDPMEIALDRQVGHLVIFDISGSTNHVLLLDARTGALKARFPRRPASESVTVDERASRAYVVNADAESIMVLDDRTLLAQAERFLR